MNKLSRSILSIAFILPSFLFAQNNERYELIKPAERSDLEVHLIELSPAYPFPGESVSLGLEVINNQDFPESQVEVRLYKIRQLTDTQVLSLNPLESKKVFFQLSAPEEEGLYPYYVEISSQNPWADADQSNNTISFDLLVSRPEEESDYRINSLLLLDEPGQLRGIQLDIENKGGSAASVPLEIQVNHSEVHRKWIPGLEPAEHKTVFLPYSDISGIREVGAIINPRFIRRGTNGSDNVLYRDFRPDLDLVIENLFIHAPEFNEGEERLITVNFTILNKGRQPIREEFSSRIKFSLFDDDDSQEILIHSNGGLPPGEAICVSKEIEGIPDEFYIRVVADANQQVLEDDEENNVASVYYRNPLPNLRRWYSIGPDKVLNKGLNATGRLVHIAISPTNSQVIFVGAVSGSGGNGTGVWKTKDGGKHWFPVTDALGFQLVKALAIDPKNSSRIILGTPHTHGDSCTLWESLDSGTSWKKMANLNTRLKSASILRFDPSTSDMYLTSTHGIYQSADNGKTWTRTLTGKIHDLVMDSNSSNTLYAAFEDSSGFSLYRSQKSGSAGSWKTIKGCGNTMLPAAKGGNMNLAISGSKLFVSYMVDTVFSIYASTNKKCPGKQEMKWEKIMEKPLKKKLTRLEADPNNANNLYAYSSGPSSIWVSHDGGKSIKLVGGKAPHVDTHGFGFDPQNSKIVYALSDGGIFKSTDRGKDGTWSFIGEGIRNSEIYYLASIESDQETLIAGTQDNGNISKQYKSKNWKEIPGAGGDGAFVAINPINKDEFYTMHQLASSLRKHSKNGITKLGCGFDPCAYYDKFFFTIVPDDPQRLLVYYNDTLWTAKNPSCAVNSKCDKKNGSTFGSSNVWSVLWKTPANSESIKRMLIDDKLDIFYAATNSGLVYYSKDRGTTFDTTAALPFRAPVFDMAFDPDQPENIYISYNTGGTNRIHLIKRFSIGNKLSYTSTDITYGLPVGREALTLAVDPITPYVLYAGTDDGVFRGQSFDKGLTFIWKAYNNGIAKGTLVSDLEIYQKTGLLRAATKGRGVYSIRNYHDDISVEIIPASKDIEPGKVFNFSVKVDNHGTSSSSFKLSVSGLEDFQYGFGSNKLTIASGKLATTALTVQVPTCFKQKEWKYLFTVTAQKVSDPKAFGQANAQILVKTPDRQLQPDIYENNNNPGSATALTVSMNQNAPWNQTPTKAQNLNLHYALDSDFYKIQFNSNSKAECAGSGPKKFGSFISSFAPQYYPGNITLSVKEEFCRPMDVLVFSYDPSNPTKAISWGKFKTSEYISISCPSEAFKASEFYVKVWRSEGDKVKYDLELSLNPWVITLGRPLYEVDPLRDNLPPHLRDWIPEWRWFDFREKFEMFRERLMELREFESLFTEGQLVKLRADMEIADGNLEEGEAMLNHSQEIFEHMGAVSAMGDVFRSRANLSARAGHMDEAHELLHVAMDHHMETGNREGVLEDIRQLLTISEDPGAFVQPFHIVNELFHQDRNQDDPAVQIESLQLMTELLLLNREIEGAMAGFILSEQLTPGFDEPLREWSAGQKNNLKHLLGSEGFQDLRNSVSRIPVEILEMEVERFLGESLWPDQ